MPSSNASLVAVHIADGIHEIILNRPDQRNALSTALCDELDAALETAAAGARAVILGANGSVFCAGADLKERAAMDGVQSRAHNRRLFGSIERIARLPVPVIAAINGPAMGGGFELALATDIRIADPAARFALPEVSLGIVPGAGGTQRLWTALGGGWARAMLLSGKPIDAATAERLGVVQELSPPGGSLDAARGWAQTIAQNAPLAVRAMKELIVAHEETPSAGGFEQERDAIFRLFLTEDRDEGLKAFAERRRPDYKGR